MFTLSLKNIMNAVMMTIALVIGIYELYELFCNFGVQWYWYPLALFYSLVINEYFGHFCCGHKVFEIDTKRITYKILAFLNCVDHAWGPPTSFALTHANHHMYADQGNRDSLNFRVHWWTGFLSPVHYIYQTPTDWPDQESYLANQQKLFHSILNDPWTEFCENNSHWLTLVYWAILYAIFPLFLFKVVFLGRTLASIYTLIGTLMAHNSAFGGYRNFDTPDHSRNKILFHYLFLCMLPTMLHNNHHGQEYNVVRGHKHKFFEFDLSVYPIRLIKFLTQKQK